MRNLAGFVLWSTLGYGFFLVFTDQTESVPLWGAITMIVSTAFIGIWATLTDLKQIDKERRDENNS